MKMVIAFLRPDRLDPAKRVLEHLPHFPGMTVTEARGFGRDKVEQRPESHRTELVDYTETVRIEVVVPKDRVAEVMDAIADHARTGRRDDGRIFVLPVERGRRIRTGEEGEMRWCDAVCLRRRSGAELRPARRPGRRRFGANARWPHGVEQR